METILRDMINILSLKQQDTNTFTGLNVDIGSGRIYGGQLLGQSLVAAAKTIDNPLCKIHSLHAHFINATDLSTPVQYTVEHLRDGKSIASRRVSGMQHGKIVFSSMASFHVEEESVQHQMTMPADVPQPDELETQASFFLKHADVLPKAMRNLYEPPSPYDVRVINQLDPLHPEKSAAESMMWFRTSSRLPADLDSPLLHQAILAFATDWGLGLVAGQPHGISIFQPNINGASLDHALWIHQREFRCDDWLLYVMDSPSMANSRGFNRGSIFTQSGQLIASVAQECLIRGTV